jgi:hypothetical protein
MFRELTRQPPFGILLATGWLTVALVLLAQNWVDTGRTMPDADDAMRLVQMRAFLAGQSWFDLHEARIAPPFGYDTHWSRLIDVGLAGFYGVLHLFTEQAMSERLLRALWPLLWLFPTMLGVVVIAWRLGGREAAMVALLFVLVGQPAYQQFMPGRIDHHNVQIALSVLTLAATVWADRQRWAAWAAGVLTGLAFAIGLEGAPYLAACGAAFALRYALDIRAAEPVRAYGLTLTAGTVAAFLLTVSPDRWMQMVCDAIAINVASAAIVGGLALAAAGAFPSPDRRVRTLAVLASGGAALAVFVIGEPRCLAGPFATVEPVVWAVWADHVPEAQPLLRLFQHTPLVASAIAAFPLAALIAALALATDAKLRRDVAFWVIAGTLVLAAATTVMLFKAFSYAVWFGMPLVAVAALRLSERLKLTTPVARLMLGLLLTPMAVSAGAIIVANAASSHETDNSASRNDRICFEVDSYAPLARLSPGLVATDIRYGPFVLALTPHSVLAAPYHRLSNAIATAHRALAAVPEEARVVLLRTQATYVVICRQGRPLGIEGGARVDSLWGHLHIGRVPDWLEPIAETQDGPLVAFRVRR